MAESDDSKHRELIRRARAELQVLKLKNRRDKEQTEQRLHHVDELKRVLVEAENNAIKRSLEAFSDAGGRPSWLHAGKRA